MRSSNPFSMKRFPSGSDESRDVNTALASASMLWRAEWRPLFLESPDSLGGIDRVDSHRALVRADNGHVLGVHGGAYTAVQQTEAFSGVQSIVDSGDATIVAAGQMGGGRKVVLELALNGSEQPVTRALGDVVRTKIVAANSHDGTSPCTVMFVQERLVCLNGMTRPSRSRLFSGRHTRGIHAALESWRAEFAEQRAALGSQVETFRALARRRLSDRNLVRYVRETLQPGAGNDDQVTVRSVDRIVELAHTAPGADPGSLWGGLNAVTYWATHERGRSDDTRASAMLFGSGGAVVERALEVAVAYADKLPEAAAGRAAYDNHATASAEFAALLGGTYTPADAQ